MWVRFNMRKILLIIVITFCIFQMVVLATAIDIGCAAITRTQTGNKDTTFVNKGNPANDSGTITSIEIYAYTGQSLVDCEVATFYRPDPIGFPNKLSTRDTEFIGAVAAGAKSTFAVSLDVQAGDYIGCKFTGGYIWTDETGEDGLWRAVADYIPCTNESFPFLSGGCVSLYGTGETVAVGWDGPFNSVTISKWNTKEIMKWNGIE